MHPLTKGRGRERRRGRGRFGKEEGSRNPVTKMVARVVAMLTRLIDRFDTDDTRNRGVPVLRFPNRSRPRRRSRPRPPCT